MYFFRKRLSICAIVGARNEVDYLQILLPLLARQGIDVVIVDNESAAESAALYSHFANNPIIRVKYLPYLGYSSMFNLIATKEKICGEIDHDWVIHHDADEIMEHHTPGKTLRQAIEDADRAGYTALNFDEFVFLPKPDENYAGRNYYKELSRYYFFEPFKNRLNRAWKRNINLTVTEGGHKLAGSDLSIAPRNHVLRHYIALSQEYVLQKYLYRVYDPQALTLGWHGNKMNFTNTNLQLPISSNFIFDIQDGKKFCKDRPALKHFWEWGNPP
jgi:hypothetical protein